MGGPGGAQRQAPGTPGNPIIDDRRRKRPPRVGKKREQATEGPPQGGRRKTGVIPELLESPGIDTEFFEPSKIRSPKRREK